METDEKAGGVGEVAAGDCLRLAVARAQQPRVDSALPSRGSDQVRRSGKRLRVPPEDLRDEAGRGLEVGKRISTTPIKID